MNPKTKNLLVRTVVGAVYVALMIAGVFVFPLMAVLLCAVACVCLYEFMSLTSGPSDKVSFGFLTAVTLTQFSLILQFGIRKSSFFYNAAINTLTNFVVMIPAMLMLLLVLLAIVELFRKRPMPLEHIGASIFSYVWIVIPLGFLAVMTRLSPQIVLAFFLMVWAYDTFAYLGGSLYGRNKMCVHISPKKTWEGSVTGLFFTIVMAIILPSIRFFGQLHAPLWQWVVLAIIVVVVGTCGDLLESLFKRQADVKDSGKIMPGHGGMLDRFDSMLLAAVPALLYALLVMVF